jgi:ADP-ribosylation factor GTPase-activating protein 1
MDYIEGCYCPGVLSLCCIFFTFLRWSLSEVQMREGGYDQKVNETVSVVANKTAELGSRTWGIMRGVMALASQKVEELSKEGGSSGWGDDWQRRDQNSEPYQRFEHETNGNRWNSSHNFSSKNYNSNSWDDWDDQGKKDEPAKSHQSGDSWAGWDDGKDDSFDSYNHSTSNEGSNHNVTSGGSHWTEGGFR